MIKTYVGEDGKIHFTNSAGADSVLNFSRAVNITVKKVTKSGSSGGSINVGTGYVLWKTLFPVLTYGYAFYENSDCYISYSYDPETGVAKTSHSYTLSKSTTVWYCLTLS